MLAMLAGPADEEMAAMVGTTQMTSLFGLPT